MLPSIYKYVFAYGFMLGFFINAFLNSFLWHKLNHTTDRLLLLFLTCKKFELFLLLRNERVVTTKEENLIYPSLNINKEKHLQRLWGEIL